MSALAELRSLTKLALEFCEFDPYTLTPAVDAWVSLTGLVELSFLCAKYLAVPAALGQLKGLRSLKVGSKHHPCVVEAGCFDLPNLLSLEFVACDLGHAEVLPGVTALQSLTRIEFWNGQGPRFFDRQLVELPRLQRVVFDTCHPLAGGACPWLSRLPADMGSLGSMVQHLSFSGHGLIEFPLALTQLVALQHLDASRNEFARLPAGVTALSRLTELLLGRNARRDPTSVTISCPPVVCALDARALGDLSGFPALRRLHFGFCELALCESMLGAVGHASLARMSFTHSHPAPGCALTVLQLGQALHRLGRGSVLRFESSYIHDKYVEKELQGAQTLPPFYKFKVALQSYGL